MLGHHIDWVSGFPFAALGLPANYSLPLISVTAFGFRCDPEFLSAGAAAWTGLALSEKQVRQRAASTGLTLPLPTWDFEIGNKPFYEIVVELKD